MSDIAINKTETYLMETALGDRGITVSEVVCGEVEVALLNMSLAPTVVIILFYLLQNEKTWNNAASKYRKTFSEWLLCSGKMWKGLSCK
jgi:uncharacterized membrane protein